MPTYDMKNIKSGEIKEMFISIAKKEEMIASGEWESVHLGSMSTIGHTGDIGMKTSGDFRDLLKKIKTGSGRGNNMKSY